MARTYTQLRQLTAQQTGLRWFSGTVDASGSSTSILRASALTRYGNDQFNGFHILLTSGSPSITELVVKDFFQSDGDARFEPELATAPDSLTFELLPFSATDFLRAIQDAISESYDRGWLARPVWMRMVGGSPLYNADFSYWTSATVVDGWTATTTTPARERASINLALSETSIALTTAAGYLALSPQWKRYLWDLLGQTLTLYCWVRTSTASSARLNLYTGSNNYSSYHSGSGQWELLSVEVSTSESATDLEPRLYIDTTSTAYFNLPFLLTPGTRRGAIREYPFPWQVMPDGPLSTSLALLDVRESALAEGRGLGERRQLGRQVSTLSGILRKHHDEDATGQVGILDFSGSPRPHQPATLLWLRGDGPLTIPN